MTLDCDVLTVHGSDLQIVVFTAEPGTPDADALALAVVVGLQELATRTAGRHVSARRSVPDGPRLDLVEAGQVVLVEVDVEHGHVLLEVGDRAGAGDQQHRSYCASSHASADLAGRDPCLRATAETCSSAARRPVRR